MVMCKCTDLVNDNLIEMVVRIAELNLNDKNNDESFNRFKMLTNFLKYNYFLDNLIFYLRIKT